MGAHQRIDRVAYSHFMRLVPKDTAFPPIRTILHFEGKNGPDGIKRKSPAKDEPWHYYSPFGVDDSGLIELISDHYDHLVRQLKKGNQERSAFEAAWLAHAIVDGLTPAHHYPFEAKLNELRGEGKETRVSVKQKIIVPGISGPDLMLKNWKMWGPKGLITTHGLFEIGVSMIIAPLRFGEARLKKSDLQKLEELGPIEYFKRAAKEIAILGMYDRYYEKGWTSKLAWQVRHRLAPTIVKTVAIFWYSAAKQAELVNSQDQKTNPNNNQIY